MSTQEEYNQLIATAKDYLAKARAGDKGAENFLRIRIARAAHRAPLDDLMKIWEFLIEMREKAAADHAKKN